MAPPGTILSISASPARIGLDGQSVITVTGRRPDGNPLPEGTEVRFSTSLGTISTIAPTDDAGVATSVLRADGRPGTATVTATTTGGEGTEVSTDVLIGESPETAPTVNLSVNPSNIPVGEDSTATVTVIARNSDGSPAPAGLAVILTTTLGRLDPDRSETDATGTARSTLTAGNQAGTAEITAFVGSSQPATTSLTIRDAATDISVQANPASVPRAGGDVTLTAFVTNSQGQGFQGAPVTFESDRGTLQTDGVVFTDTRGVARNTLSLTQEQLEDLAVGATFEVTASTPLGTGELIEVIATIRVE